MRRELSKLKLKIKYVARERAFKYSFINYFKLKDLIQKLSLKE